jgi:hypothetical protein
MERLLNTTTSICDRAMQLVMTGQAFAAFRILGPELSRVRDVAVTSGRERQFTELVRKHPLFELCQEDPYTARALSKPRGYAGDAVMMDYVYSGEPPSGTSEVGRQIFRATTRVPMGLSVLYRRSRLQSHLNEEIARRPACRILSVASGHCREIEGSLLFANVSDCELIALDQDAEAGSVVAAEYPTPNIRVMTERVKTLMSGRHDLGEFDFIYSAGLYDYLPDAMASRLTNQLISMLKPGGRLLIANFLHGCYGRGYLEAFMDWRLLYRSSEELRCVFPERCRAEVRITSDPHENVAYALFLQ